MWNKFFGSKSNTILLIILIILMVMALRFMLQNKQVYLLPLVNSQQQARQQTILQKDDLQLIPWNTVFSAGEKIYYDSSWVATAYSDDPDTTIFILPSGATVTRGGRQSGCSQEIIGRFEYGVSN